MTGISQIFISCCLGNYQFRSHIFFCKWLNANPAINAKPMISDGSTTGGIASGANNPINSKMTPEPKRIML